MVKVIDNSDKPKTSAEKSLLDIATYVMTEIDFAEGMIIE